MRDRRWAAAIAGIAGLGLVLLLVLTLAARPAERASSPAPTVAGSTATPMPSPTETATSSPAATFAPTVAPTAAGRSSLETARQLASALEASDYDRLRALVTPNGWMAGYFAGEGTQRLTPDETIAWLRQRAPSGRIQADVSEQPFFQCRPYHPCRDMGNNTYIRSVWTDFETPGSQHVDLVLEKIGDSWYWSAALFRAPPE